MGMIRKKRIRGGHAVWQARRRKMKKRRLWGWSLGIVGAAVIVALSLGGYAYSNLKQASQNSYYPVHRNFLRNPQRQIHRKGALSILFLGTDTDHLSSNHDGQTDTVIVDTVNPKGRMTMTTLPENLRTKYDGDTLPLKRLYQRGGVSAVTKYVQKSLRIPVDYYMLSDMKGLATTASQVGGIKVTPNQTFTSRGVKFRSSRAQLMKRQQVMAYLKLQGNGTQADYQRQDRNKQVLLALFNKIAHDPLKSNNANALSGDVHTDLSFNDLEHLTLHYRNAAQNKQHVILKAVNQVKSDPHYQKLSPHQKRKVINVIRQNLEL